MGKHKWQSVCYLQQVLLYNHHMEQKSLNGQRKENGILETINCLASVVFSWIRNRSSYGNCKRENDQNDSNGRIYRKIKNCLKR